MESNYKANRRKGSRPLTLWNLSLMADIGLNIMWHNKLRLVATLLGVIFASILANQSIGIMLALINKSAMLIRNAKADIWILPPATEFLVPGRYIATSSVLRARSSAEVADAQPFLLAGGSIALPNGSSDGLTLVGTTAPAHIGGPWNVVAATPNALAGDQLILESADLVRFPGVTLGSTHEVNGQSITISGLTWGAQQMEAPLAFGSFDLVRDLAKIPIDKATAGLVVLRPGVDPATARARLQQELPEAMVVTKAELDKVITNTMLTKTPIGVVFGSLAAFGIAIGFVMVSLSVFSGVSENLREFGTLRAIGARTGDLTILMLIQACAYATMGSVIGIGLVSAVALLIRSAALVVVIEPFMIWSTFAAMVLMCCSAALVSMVRIWRIEPGMVFR